MEYNFNALLDEMIPQDMAPPKRKQREPPAFLVRPHKFSMGSMQGPIFRQEFSVEVDRAMVNLNFAEQTLFFRIPLDSAPFECPILQGTCPIDDLQSVRLDKRAVTSTAILTITLRRPPRIEADFRGIPDADAVGLTLRRATELDWSPDDVQEGGSGAPGTLPRGFRVSTPMKLGLWLTYSFEFNYHPKDLKRVSVSLSRLRTLERPGAERIAVEDGGEPDLVDTTGRNRNPYAGINVTPVDQLLQDSKYPFDARYLLVGLVSQGLILPREIPDLLHHLWPIHPTTRVAVLRALFRLERRALVGHGARDQIRDLTRHMPDLNSVKRKSKDLPVDRVSMRRAVVTPTRVLLFPEVIETSNRVLRHWPAEMRAGRFIRVGFADEDGRLRISRRIADMEEVDPDGGVLARIGNVLRNGIWIAGRHYVFLAAGESQLKDHSCWMVCEDGDFTADRVRAQMGDFSGEHVVAKCAARMGLCFSATRHVADLVETDVEPLEDIKHGDYVYTDGVGNCSQELATMCARALGSDQKAPSAVQIRMGGMKGVLSVHPHLENNQLCIRPSMNKFESPHLALGVMKVSRFAPAHLNRQAICVMSALGMNTHALLQLFTRQIQHAENLELELQTLDTSRHPAKHVYKNALIPVTKMIKAGLIDQLLLRNVLRCIKCQLLRDLKYKARVLVPDGAYLMGIADEYDVLEEGQIYCAVTPTGTNSRKVITGQCTIFRSPCIHPGDARRVTAVDNIAFQELPLTNVVVFSTKKAPRDLPSMLGGGDLDGVFDEWFLFPDLVPSGDFYTVIYDKDLQITREHEPMDYTAVTPVRKDKVEIEDICDFVVDFIKSDVLGIVASNHQAIADRLGPEHENCLELAKLNSDAVDFAKSGVPVHIPTHLRPKWFPDFMGKDPDVSYPSTRPLGMMYRLIEPAPEYQPLDDLCIDTRLTSRRVPPSYLKAAGEMKQNYDVDLEGIMRQHSLCEAEIIAGVAIMSDQRRRRAADDAIRGPVREGMEALRAKYRRLARSFVKETPSGSGLESWALACYQITHVDTLRRQFVDALNHSRRGSAAVSDDGTEDGEYSEVTRRELISFPWMWAHEICHSLDDATIKEEEEEEEDCWHNRWDSESDSEEEG
ncbi:RNA dependent RNA polymerase-domain-containing protein [Mycena alexandri]|uniref:RNA-dependent RNA polymerase n=1 Tax=Mycena alexandri TaxID=1745969 RepID=A0AAD6X1F2_9AGAR|nr:RNA dependent RNA polymerase-domain-containing protein [Mycena alexandri]